MNREKYEHSGKQMKIKNFVSNGLAGKIIEVEDYWENVSGKSWMLSDGNIAAMNYGFRTGTQGGVPINDEVVYGKVDGLGYLLHVSELEEK